MSRPFQTGPVTSFASSRVTAVAGLTIGHAVDDLYQGAVPAILPFLVAERGYSYAAATGITLAATLLSSVAQPAFGILTDRHQLRWLVPAGMATAAAGVGLSGLGGSYLATWLAIAVSGLGVAAYHPEAARAARAAGGSSARAMSWFVLGGNLGLALAPLLVTPVLAAYGLAATPLLVLPAAVAAALFALGRRRRPAGRRPGEGAASGGAGMTAGPAEDWRAFGWLTGVVICRSICYFGVSSFLALYLIRQLGASRAAGSAVLTVFGAAGAVGTLLGGWLADRSGRLRAVQAGYALAVPGLAGLLAAPGPELAAVAGAVLGLALFLPFSVQVTLAQEYLPARVGTASGLTVGLAVSVGGVLAPLLGVLADHAGLRAALAVLVLLPAAALLASTRLPEPDRPHRQGPAMHDTTAAVPPAVKHPPSEGLAGPRSVRRPARPG